MPTQQNKQLIGFFALMGVVGLAAFLMLWPFWQMLALAGIFAVLFHPLYQRINNDIKSENLASALTIIIIMMVAILPLWLIGQLLFNELVEVYNQFRLGNLVFDQSKLADYLPDQLQNLAQTFSNDLNVIASRLTGSAFDLVSGFLSNLASFFLSLFLIIFMLFFFLRDGQKIKQLALELSPLSNVYDRTLVEKLQSAISGVVKGSFLTALIQGFVAALGFTIFGVPQPVLWGAFTVLAALVPTVGTSLSIIPAIIFLLITGHTGAAIGLTIWGALAVGMIDNIVSPKLIGSKVKMHELLVLLSVLGGIQVFGFLGFLFGPILMSIFVTLVQIYKDNLKQKI